MNISLATVPLVTPSLSPSSACGPGGAQATPDSDASTRVSVACYQKSSDLLAHVSPRANALPRPIPALTPACMLVGASAGAALEGFTIGQRVGQTAAVLAAVNGGVAAAAIGATAGGLLASVLTSNKYGVLGGAVTGGLAGAVGGAVAGLRFGGPYTQILGFVAGGVLGAGAGYMVGHSIEHYMAEQPEAKA